MSTQDHPKYADILKKARQTVNLNQLGIDNTRVKRAITGGILIEIPGENNTQKADALANCLRTALYDDDHVKITRPVKRADLRISGLDDSTTPEEVKSTIANIGGCAIDDIRAGNIRLSPRGMGTIWIQCPLAAALTIQNTERIRIGWTSVTVHLLQQRQLQCYRCFEKGHVRQYCNSPIDRSGRCYNCGSTAHQARNCKNRMKCPLCSDYGLPSSHKVGGDSCNPPKRMSNRRKTPNMATVVNSEPTNMSHTDMMDTTETPSMREPDITNTPYIDVTGTPVTDVIDTQPQDMHGISQTDALPQPYAVALPSADTPRDGLTEPTDWATIVEASQAWEEAHTPIIDNAPTPVTNQQ